MPLNHANALQQVPGLAWLLWETAVVTERLLTTGQAAQALGIPKPTLNMWIRDWGIEPTDRTIGNHMRWDLDDLRRKLTAAREEADKRRAEKRERKPD